MKSVSAIEAKFKRSGIHTIHTKIWKEVAPQVQEIVSKAMRSLHNELNILCFFPSENYWWVLTDKHVVISDANNLQYVSLTRINKVQVPDIQVGIQTKHDTQTLCLDTQQGKLVLNLEEGTWPVIYDIFKFIL